MWHDLFNAVMTAQFLNLAFAVETLSLAVGADGRVVAVVLASLYLALVFV